MAARREEIPALDVAAEDRGIEQPFIAATSADEEHDVRHAGKKLGVGLAKQPLHALQLLFKRDIEPDGEDDPIAGPWGDDAHAADADVIGVAKDPLVADARLMNEMTGLGKKRIEERCVGWPTNPDEVGPSNALEESQRARHAQRRRASLARRRPSLHMEGEGAILKSGEKVGGMAARRGGFELDPCTASDEAEGDGRFTLGAPLPLGSFIALEELEELPKGPKRVGITGALGDAIGQFTAQAKRKRRCAVVAFRVVRA